MAESPILSLRLAPDELAVIDPRASRHGEPPDNGERSQAVRVILARYESICRRDLPTLTVPEWKLVCDCLNGVWLNDTGEASGDRLRFVWAELEDGIRLNGLDQKWDVPGPPLVAKVRSLTQGQLVALVDYVERWWASVNTDHEMLVPGEEAPGVR